MSVYLVKLVELISINIESDQSFLHIKLTTEKDVELLWKIDDFTAENLKALTVFGEHHKYRLSFYSSWDSTKNQYISYLTRTFLDQSEKIYFACSEAYVKGLKAIKTDEVNSQILLPSIANSLSIEPEKKKHKKSLQSFAWVSLVFMSVLTIVLVANSLLSMAETNENSKELKKNKTQEIEIPIASLKGKTDSFQKTSIPEQESVLPIVELSENVNYSIQEGNVALTFDDGPSKFTKEITDILKEHDVGGTFFFIGKNVEKHYDSIQYVKSNGYSIGSHSMHHHNFTNLSVEQQEYELLHTNKLIENITQEKITLFRPPYGSKNEITIELMDKTNTKMVLWNADTEDWKSQNANEIVNYVVNSKTSGSIILLHESQAVIEALPRIIEHLKNQGLHIVSLN